ncbi:MgtC/SapB family protein [Jannaschia sp. S6380]|uniref:MgtC/SapB family protein n=1 Tax=Jannaschia sp. S6380 TaxID=2926408 RepID=UPI001FF58DBA|nr:MgtC/SapB family protein [Jannaschia sp. S6380]MCK0167761.1 MgtC/SapB family protein [Jannaschia sp. S6380]
MLGTIFEDMSGSFTVISPGVSAARLLLAVVLCGIIGFERERRAKPAGLRTHMLVGIAACLFIIVGQELGSLNYGTQTDVRTDPLRLIEAVTAGVAFLAAGIIFTAKGEVRNITTGASMWLAGAVGLACGAGQGLLAGMATIIVVTVIAVLGAIERRYAPKHNEEPEAGE